jgi:hypothetical protein
MLLFRLKSGLDVKIEAISIIELTYEIDKKGELQYYSMETKKKGDCYLTQHINCTLYACN